MRRKLMWVLVLSAVIVGAAAYVGNVQATPAVGIHRPPPSPWAASATSTPTTMCSSRTISCRRGSRISGSRFQKTKGPSDLYVQSNVWAPGGTTGWHTHPGHSLIIVTAGTVTAYDGHDPSCTPHVYTAGMGLVDAGGDHVHVIRNEGSVEARTVAVQLIPAGATRRIDADGNAGCPF